MPYTDIGSTLKLTWDTKLITQTYSMSLRAQDSSYTDILRTSVVISKTSINNQLTIIVPENTTSISCFITAEGNSGSKIFLDNLSLVVQ